MWLGEGSATTAFLTTMGAVSPTALVSSPKWGRAKLLAPVVPSLSIRFLFAGGAAITANAAHGFLGKFLLANGTRTLTRRARLGRNYFVIEVFQIVVLGALFMARKGIRQTVL